MTPWYVYMVECSDNTLYIGTTNDVKKRTELHNNGRGAKYTRGRTPVIIRFTLKCKNRSEACQYEYQFKGYSKVKKLKLIHQFSQKKAAENTG